MRDFDLKRLQQVELEMLKDVAKFCDDNGIVYFIDSGTLLGAVRHGGFIPWDDDIDICMDLRNYKKFCELAPKGLPKKYFVQNYHTDPKACIKWSRVRINGTTSMESNMTTYDIHYGICMDIFVKVGLAKTKLGKKIQNFASEWLTTFLGKYSNLASGVTLPNKIRIMYAYMPEWFRRFIICVLEKIVFLDTRNREYCYNTWYNPSTAKIYPSKMYQNTSRVKIKFEDAEFWAPKEYIKYLEVTYGDWKTPPSDTNRSGHGDIIVDFEKDYSFYQDNLNKNAR